MSKCKKRYTEQISADLRSVKLLKSCRFPSRALLKDALNPPQNIGFLVRKGLFRHPRPGNFVVKKLVWCDQ